MTAQHHRQEMPLASASPVSPAPMTVPALYHAWNRTSRPDAPAKPAAAAMLATTSTPPPATRHTAKTPVNRRTPRVSVTATRSAPHRLNTVAMARVVPQRSASEPPMAFAAAPAPTARASTRPNRSSLRWNDRSMSSVPTAQLPQKRPKQAKAAATGRRVTAGSPPRGLAANGFGQEVNLGDVGRAGKQDQLVTGGLGERVDGPPNRPGRGQRAARDHVHDARRERVVVAQIPVGQLGGVGAEGKVRQGEKARAAFAAGICPCRGGRFGPDREELRAATAGDPPVAPAGDPGHRGRVLAAEDDRRPAAGAGGRPDGAGDATRLARPNAVHLLELGVEQASSPVEVDAAGRVVVLA